MQQMQSSKAGQQTYYISSPLDGNTVSSSASQYSVNSGSQTTVKSSQQSANLASSSQLPVNPNSSSQLPVNPNSSSQLPVNSGSVSVQSPKSVVPESIEHSQSTVGAEGTFSAGQSSVSTTLYPATPSQSSTNTLSATNTESTMNSGNTPTNSTSTSTEVPHPQYDSVSTIRNEPCVQPLTMLQPHLPLCLVTVSKLDLMAYIRQYGLNSHSINEVLGISTVIPLPNEGFSSVFHVQKKIIDTKQLPVAELVSTTKKCVEGYLIPTQTNDLRVPHAIMVPLPSSHQKGSYAYSMFIPPADNSE